jgi:PAS domain S-box-containing protein
MKRTDPRSLDSVLLRLLLLRLFLPLLALTLLASGLTTCLSERRLEAQQRRLARSLAQRVEDYLDQAGRVLDAVALVAETSTLEELDCYMQATHQAYGYFDTLYRLDENGIIILLAPPSPRYQGLDMSNKPYFREQRSAGQNGVIFSEPPFISPRTGQLTTVLTRWLDAGGLMVGELNLRTLQGAIVDEENRAEADFVFITDRSGTLLAHPQSDQVAQHVNVSHLNIVQWGLAGETTLLYSYDGEWMLGSATQVERAGWVVVVQEPFFDNFGPYLGSTGLLILLALLLWLVLMWNLRWQLRRHVVAPLARLSRSANALAEGDFVQSEALVNVPTTLAEVNALGTHFDNMSQAIQARQTALQESEERLRKVVQNMPVMMEAFDNQGNIVVWNRECERVTGYSAQEIVGNPQAMEWLYPDQARRERMMAQWAERGHDYREWEWEITCKDGSTRTIAWSNISEHFAIPGWGAWGIGVDVTERVRAESEREALIRELETKNVELGRFTYTVSHDLKSPLITIMGFLGFLEQDALAGNVESVKTDIARIADAANRMQRLLNELLELSRIGRLTTPSQDVSMGELAREAVNTVAGRLATRGAQVEIAPALLQPDGPTVYGERPRLLEVLENLVDNAVKFMGDQPEPRIEIGTRRDGKETVFYVQDNGIGIDPHYHDEVFGLFKKLDPESEGTGAGLAIVKRIVEVHGGRIWIESEGEGQGSTFGFTLPGKRQAIHGE